ncbi:hypothetical protein ACS0TY_008149 [Phlomoides rotata]
MQENLVFWIHIYRKRFVRMFCGDFLEKCVKDNLFYPVLYSLSLKYIGLVHTFGSNLSENRSIDVVLGTCQFDVCFEGSKPRFNIGPGINVHFDPAYAGQLILLEPPGYTISKHFNNVLNILLKLYTVLLVKLVPVPEDSIDNRWRDFKVLSFCLMMDGSTNLNLGGRVRKMVIPTNRRVWTYAEELELVENVLSVKFPGTDLKGDPHINSKIHVWKKTIRMSEVDVRCLWNRVEQFYVDHTARGMKNKTFPFYQDRIKIFRNDCANGN